METAVEVLPELITKADYVAAQIALDRDAGLQTEPSAARIKELHGDHLQHVRIAVYFRRPVHVENKTEYKGVVPGLGLYAVKGNIAEFWKE